MKDKMQNIRAVLESAVKLELPGSASALQDLNDMNAKIMTLEEAYNELVIEMGNDMDLDGGINCG